MSIRSNRRPQARPNSAIRYGIACFAGLLPHAHSIAATTGDCSGHLEAIYPLLSLQSPGLPGLAAGATELRAMFGRTMAVGDFNGDGTDDLAIAHRQTGPSDAAGARGSVLVIPGGAGGPDPGAAIRLTSEGVEADPPQGFGESLAVADFNGDGFDDLAVGAPGLGAPVAGKVYVFHGAVGGPDQFPNQVWDRDVGTIPGVAGDEDGFGLQLVAGHFDGDAFADLAIGAGKNFESPALIQGVAHVLFGDGPGLTAEGNLGLQYVPMGSSALSIDLRTSIDTNSDGVDEIVTSPNVGAGVSAPYACLLHDLRATDPSWSCFGATSSGMSAANLDPGTFAVGDFDGDGHGELVSGENGYSHTPPIFSGRTLRWQPQLDVVGILEPAAQVIAPEFVLPYVDVGRFGSNHVAVDLDADGYSDLVVGESGWSDASVPVSSGRIHAFAGSSGGLDALAFQTVDASTVAAVLTPQSNLRLGNAIVAGDFNADGCMEVSLAVPGRSPAGLMSAGGVLVLGNSSTPIFRDGFDP